MEISEAQHNTASEFVDLVATRLGESRAVHSATAIASAARLAGSLLLRSFKLDIEDMEPGTVILSTEANEAGPELVNILGAMLERFGVSLDNEKLGTDGPKRDEEPEMSVIQSLGLLQDDALVIAQKNGLDLKEAAQAAAIATAFIVKECENGIGGEMGFNIATYSFIEGCKTIPPVEGTGRKFNEKKPWYKFW